MTKSTFKRAEHRNAIVKMVKEKRMILLADLSSVMNRTNIKSTVDILVKDGKFKKQKIQVRGPVGNLTNQWLIYDNSVKQNDILDFERQTVNRTFQSPLVENHCYKSPEEQIEQVLKPEVVEKSFNNPILDYFNTGRTDSKILKTDNQTELTVITNEIIPIYGSNNERIVNARELHEFLQVKDKFATWIIRRIEKYGFIEDEDYIRVSRKCETSTGATVSKEYYLKMDTAKEIAMVQNNEKGRYIRKYFIQIEKDFKQQNSIPQTNSIEAIQNVYDFMRIAATGITDLNDRVKSLETTIDSMKRAITG